MADVGLAVSQQTTEVGYVFISHSRLDGVVVERFAALLGRARVDVWMDDSLDYCEEFPQRLVKKVSGSAVFVPVMSPCSEASDWVPRECDEAKSRWRLIMPISLDGHRFGRFEHVHSEVVSGGAALSDKYIHAVHEAVDEAAALTYSLIHPRGGTTKLLGSVVG